MSDPSNPLGYPDQVWRLFRDTPRAGRLEGATVVGEAATSGTELRLRLELRIDAGRIADACFLAHGCPYTIATGSWLAETLAGQPVALLAAPPVAALRAALEIPEERAHCWLMAQDVLRDLHRQLS